MIVNSPVDNPKYRFLNTRSEVMLRITCVYCVLPIFVVGAISRRADADLPGQIVTALDDGADGPSWSITVIDPNTGTYKRKLQPGRSATRLCAPADHSGTPGAALLESVDSR